MDESVNNVSKVNYPGVSERVKAAVTDSFVIIGFMFGIALIFSELDNVPDYYRKLAFLFIFGLYDPIFTSLFGGTIGHIAMNIRVKRRNNTSKNILFPLAIIRFIIKFILGIVSLLTVGSSKERLAIHDVAVGSIVLKKT